MNLFNKVVFISASALPTLVSAASTSPAIQVHVPFTFRVGAQQFTAGDYRVQQSDNGLIFVQGEGKGAAALSIPAETKAGTPTSLRFTSSQQHEYLVGVQVQGESSRSIPMPAEEGRKLTITSNR